VSEFFKRFSPERKKTPAGSSQQGTSDQPTQPLSHPANAGFAHTPGDSSSQFQIGVANSIGMLRDHNEDALFALTTSLISDSTNLPFGIYIIADGMGGHLHGEKASEVAMRAMANHVLTRLLPSYLDITAFHPEDSEQEIMEEGIQAAHRAIIKHAAGGGSTLTGMLLLGEKMIIAHIGDSRAYKIQTDEGIQQLTRDHSLVKRLEELGQITSDEAAIHPQRNVLYRALGQEEPIDPEISTAPLPQSGFLLLCSDGLWGMISESELKNIIFSAKSPQYASQELIEAANAAGGPDNISVILIQLADTSQS
jgi:serine/threonine protein phosphatase PrpC